MYTGCLTQRRRSSVQPDPEAEQGMKLVWDADGPDIFNLKGEAQLKVQKRKILFMAIAFFCLVCLSAVGAGVYHALRSSNVAGNQQRVQIAQDAATILGSTEQPVEPIILEIEVSSSYLQSMDLTSFLGALPR